MKITKQTLKFDKNTIKKALYIVNNKVNFHKLTKQNQKAFLYLEHNFFKTFNKQYKNISFVQFNSFFYNLGLLLEDKSLSFDNMVNIALKWGF